MPASTPVHQRVSSLRARLAALFAIGTAALLLASAGLLYLSLQKELDAAVAEALSASADDVSAEVEGGALSVPGDEPFAELIGLDGRVLDSSAVIAGRRVLSPTELRRAQSGEIVVDHTKVPGLGKRARILARPLRAPSGENLVVVVGSSLDAVLRSGERVGVALAVASPALAVVLAGGGYLLTGAALGPVERMTEEAAIVNMAEPGRRLPLPPGDDEIVHLGKTLNTMLDRIEVSFARERAFVDDASHELRTPIAIARAELELGLQRPRDRHGMAESMRSALEEVERLGQLAEHLLVLARADAGTLPIRRERVALRSLAQDLASRLEAQPGPPIEVTGPDVVVEADPLSLEQMLANLVDNARRFAEAQVRIDLADDDPGARVTVADDGPGFPPSLVPVSFGRFARADLARGRSSGGPGLGLAIVAALAGAHGGSVEASNGAPLGGAAVTIRLPGAVPDAERSLERPRDDG